MFEDLMGLIARCVKWGGVAIIIKIVLLVFGGAALVFVLHFAWVLFGSIFTSIRYAWDHRNEITGGGTTSTGFLLMLPVLRIRFRRQR